MADFAFWDIAVFALAFILYAAGFVTSIVSVLPGPLLAYCALLCLTMSSFVIPVPIVVVYGVLMVIVMALDFVVPMLGAKKFKCSRWGTAGCVVGSIVGAFFFPLGILLGPFLGALTGELIAGKRISQAAQGGFGAFLGFLLGTLIKVVYCISILGIFLA